MIEVPVETNKPLKEGDVLFRIDPKPYEYIVEPEEGLARGSRAECEAAASPRSIRPPRRSDGRTRSSSWRSRTTTGNSSCSRRRSSPRRRSTHTRAISKRRDRVWSGREPKRSGHGSPTRRTSMASTPRSRALRAELADAQYDLEQTVARAPGGRLRHAGGVAAGGVRGAGAAAARDGVRQYQQEAIRNSGRRSSRTHCSASRRAMRPRSPSMRCRDACSKRQGADRAGCDRRRPASGQRHARRLRRAHRRRPRARGHRYHRRHVRLSEFRSGPPARSRSIPSTGITSR